MANAIQDAISKAKAIADQAPAATAANLPSTTPAAGLPAAPGRTLGMEDVAGRGIMVDEWVGVKEFGIVAGKDRVLVPSVNVALDMNEIAVHFAIKFGNPAQYFKSYDGVTCAQGGSWADAVAKAMRSDPTNKGEYRSVDLPMVVLEDVVVEVQEGRSKVKKTVLEKGTKIGYSTSTTNWRTWEAFYRALVAAGLQRARLNVQLGFQPMKNKNNNAWGIMTFTLLGAIDDDEDQAEAA